MTASDMIVTNFAGRSFTVRVVRKGDRYGLEDRLTHTKSEPMIEFYDRTHIGPAFGPRGQFVARYYASTIAEHSRDRGLCMDMGVPVWSIEGPILVPVIALAADLLAR